MPTLCNLYYFNHLNMWLANEVDYGKLWSLGQYALCTKCTWSFLLPVRLESRPLVVSVTLPDTRSENLCAPMWHHPWGNSKTVESGTPGLFCGKLFKLKLCPQRLPFWHSRLQAQFMCNKIKTLKRLSCTHIQACMCTEGSAQGHTDMVNSCLGQELGQTWERQLPSYPKHFFLPQLCTLSFWTLIRGCC